MTTTALDDVVLLVSEVVTNAVVHSQSGREPDGQVSVYVARTPSVIHIEVTDGGSAITQPAMGAADPESDGGRGLWLVNLLATAWGTHQHDEAGAAVWFQVTAK